MSREKLTRRRLERLLQPPPAPEPPADLAARIKAEIPDSLPRPGVHLELERPPAARLRPWLAAASLVAALGAGMLAYTTLRQAPVSEQELSEQVVREGAVREAPAATAAAPEAKRAQEVPELEADADAAPGAQEPVEEGLTMAAPALEDARRPAAAFGEGLEDAELPVAPAEARAATPPAKSVPLPPARALPPAAPQAVERIEGPSAARQQEAVEAEGLAGGSQRFEDQAAPRLQESVDAEAFTDSSLRAKAEALDRELAALLAAEDPAALRLAEGETAAAEAAPPARVEAPPEAASEPRPKRSRRLLSRHDEPVALTEASGAELYQRTEPSTGAAAAAAAAGAEQDLSASKEAGATRGPVAQGGQVVRISDQPVTLPEYGFGAVPRLDKGLLAVSSGRVGAALVLPYSTTWQFELYPGARVRGGDGRYEITLAAWDAPAASEREYLEQLRARIESSDVRVRDAIIVGDESAPVLRYRSQPKQLPADLRARDPWWWHYWSAEKLEASWADAHLTVLEPTKGLPAGDAQLVALLGKGLVRSPSPVRAEE